MRFSDIKTGYIYNIIFDPVRDCEFDGKHLALVLKKNNDKVTFIVMPLTSAANGVGINKIELGQIDSLPMSLKGNHTYAVFNQIRTVNASRFIALKEGGSVIECPMKKSVFTKLILLGITELIHSISQDERISILKTAYESEKIVKSKDLAYTIIGLRKTDTGCQKQISALKDEIRETLQNIPYSLEQKYVDDGIQDIFEEALQD